MKVICIDNKPHKDSYDVRALSMLREGEVYEAFQSENPLGYRLKEIPTPNSSGFFKSRFIPLSEMDETEFVREENLVNH
jgi:hypothetical protein